MDEDLNVMNEPLPVIKLIRFRRLYNERIRFSIHSVAMFRALICLLLVAMLVFTFSGTFIASISQAPATSSIDVTLAFSTTLSIFGILFVAIALISATFNQQVIINRETRVLSFMYQILGIPLRKINVSFEKVMEIKQLPYEPFLARRGIFNNTVSFVLWNGKQVQVANSFSLKLEDQEKLIHFLHNTIILDK